MIAEELKISGEYQNLQFVSSEIHKLSLQDVNIDRLNREPKIEFLIENKIFDLKIKSFSCQSNLTFYGSEYENVLFEGVFEKSINFGKDIKIKNLCFESSTFKKRIDFEEGQFVYVSFSRSIFQSLVLINEYKLIKEMAKDIKIETLTMHSCIFDMDMQLQIVYIKKLNISHNSFKQLFHFNNDLKEWDVHNSPKQEVDINIDGTNQGNIIIEKANADLSLRDINLGNIIFKDLNLSFLCLQEFQNNGNVTFSNIKSGKHFILSDSITGNINFINFDINIFKEIIIANSTLNGINFNVYPNSIRSYSKDSRLGFGLKEKKKNAANLRSIYNQLKHIARNKGDVESSIKYQSLEYKTLLISKKIGFDSILLLLNWLSNDNGRSWLRGILFTLIVGLFFFIVYLITIGISFDLLYQYQDYVIFITSFPKLELEKYSCENNYWTVKLVIWLSRIFISYGVYQTIVAFRKYGKG